MTCDCIRAVHILVNAVQLVHYVFIDVTRNTSSTVIMQGYTKKINYKNKISAQIIPNPICILIENILLKINSWKKRPAGNRIYNEYMFVILKIKIKLRTINVLFH